MAYSEALAGRIRAVLAGAAGITERRMFGGIAFLKHGHMFVGVLGDTLMARVGKAAHAASLARRHVRPMDFTGRPLAGYVYVGADGLSTDTQLAFWVRHCEQFASALPPKAPKKARASPKRRRAGD